MNSTPPTPSTPSTPSTPLVPATPSNSIPQPIPSPQPLQQYCFNNPGLPYVKSRQPPPPPFCIQTTEDHVNTVTDICSAYGQCEFKNCKASFPGHAVMCPTQDFYVSSCLYQWAQLGTDADKEKFIKNGTMFANFDINNVQDCINVDNLFKL